jgi:ATP-dependent DNA helicase DinG
MILFLFPFFVLPFMYKGPEVFVMLNKFVVIDLETTGNLPKKGEKIIQFAAVVIENGKVTEKFSSLVNPQKPIPAFIEELTGLNNEMVKEAPVFSEIASKIISLLDDAYFVAHNVLFDLSFIQEELQQSGYEGFYGPVLDTVELARILYPTADGYKLSDLAERENLQHDRPHQADSDAQVTAELLQILLNRLSLIPRKVLKELRGLSGGLKSDIQQLLDEFLVRNSRRVEELPTTIEIFHGIALKKNDPFKQTLNDVNNHYPVKENEKIKLLKNAIDPLEERTGQFQMMDCVYRAFIDKSNTLIEAGTGIGKSIGYLLPAAYFAKNHKLPIVISTHTIQLQEQLIHKEIPVLSKMLPFELKSVLLKGRNHYLSLEKFISTLKDENDNYDTTLTKMQILIWLMETTTGDKDELNLSSGGLIYWNKIKSDIPIFGQNKDWWEKDFYLKARKEAEEADIIITNHSLLLSDINANYSILPNYDYVIIDEGHHLEKTASHFLGRTLDYLSIRLLLGQLGLYEQRLLFYQIEALLKIIPDKQEGIVSTIEVNQTISNLYYEMDEFFKMAAILANRKTGYQSGLKRQKVKLSIKEQEKELSALVHCAERFYFLLKDVQIPFEKRMDLIKKEKSSLTYEQKNILEELNIFLLEIGDLRDSIREIMLKESDFVRWVEIDTRSTQNVTTIFAEPDSVAKKLKTEFFQMKKGIVITSATLTVNESYDFVMKELGLDSGSTNTLTIPSPFDYKNQVHLLIPDDLPEIKLVSNEDYVIAITEHLITIAEATKGRMLVLFTSHEMLRKTHELIKESGFLEDFAIIAQGITSGSRTRLTRNFQRYEKAILLGTSSFWEGIDIPGEDLSCLVIVRLPFSSPDEPFAQAKCEYVKKQGGNAFTDYSLPEAILRFKQGFGRLIRTEMDRGIMVVFDRRIVTTNYGHSFLKSIPAIQVKNGPIDELVEFIHSWL